MKENIPEIVQAFFLGAGVVLTVYIKPAVVATWKHWNEYHKGRTEAFQQLASAVNGQTAILGTQTKMLQEIHTTWKRSQGIEAAALALLESRLKETRLEMRRTLRGTRQEVRAIDDRIDQMYGLLANLLIQLTESLSDQQGEEASQQLDALGVRTRELTRVLRRIEVDRERRHSDFMHEMRRESESEDDLNDEHSEVIERLFDSLTEDDD